MEQNSNVTETVITTINTIFENLFSSIDNNLYEILDKITFVSQDILKDKYFEKIFGTSTTNGILLIANSLLIGFLLYYATKFIMSNLTYSKIESPSQFLFKMLIFGICMNSSYFIVEQILSFNYNITQAIQGLGEDLFNEKICFSNLIISINTSMAIDTTSMDIFSLDGLIKGTLTVSLLNLVFSYSLRFVMIKIFVIISPFAFLSLSQESTSWFFRTWFRNLFSLLFIQIIVAIVLLILFSMDYSSKDLLTKFIYIGGIYALIKANSFVREFIGGVSTNVGR